MDRRFGRTQFFLMVDIETGATEVLSNEQHLNAAQGAGIQAAQHVINHGADCVVTGHCGPKAFRVLETADIKVYQAETGTVREALAALKSGNLVQSSGSDVEGHWV